MKGGNEIGAELQVGRGIRLVLNWWCPMNWWLLWRGGKLQVDKREERRQGERERRGSSLEREERQREGERERGRSFCSREDDRAVAASLCLGRRRGSEEKVDER